MADIFLSYDRDDHLRAKQLATALAALGWDVWWDRKIVPGTSYRVAIAQELESAKCVVVLWSQKSIRSDWVCDEAEDAMRRRILVPAIIEQVMPPHGFRQQQTADLIAWKGDSDDPEFELLKNGIQSHASLQSDVQSASGKQASEGGGGSRAGAVSLPPDGGSTELVRETSVDETRQKDSSWWQVKYFDFDIYISYAHKDDIALAEGQPGWVSQLHRSLEIRVGQLLGRAPRIWRDPKLQGNDIFLDGLFDQLQRVAVFVSVLTPLSARSEWCRRELKSFCDAATQQGGIRVGDRARLFKVIKTPVSLELHPHELQSLLGYEFFRADPYTGKMRELYAIGEPTAQTQFWTLVDDLAHDIVAVLADLPS